MFKCSIKTRSRLHGPLYVTGRVSANTVPEIIWEIKLKLHYEHPGLAQTHVGLGIYEHDPLKINTRSRRQRAVENKQCERKW